MLRRDHIYTLSSKLPPYFFIKMHHKQWECVRGRKKKEKKTIYSLLVCKFDMTWLLSIRWREIRAAATRQSDGRRLRGAAFWVQGRVSACYCAAPCEAVLCVSIIMGTESSVQAGAVEKRPPGREALSCHYREGRPANNGDIMRAGDRLSFSKWEMVRICGIPSQQAHSHWLVPGLSYKGQL